MSDNGKTVYLVVHRNGYIGGVVSTRTRARAFVWLLDSRTDAESSPWSIIERELDLATVKGFTAADIERSRS